MERTITLLRLWNIPIGVHPSWFLIFGLVTWSLATGYFPAEYPQLSLQAHWALGLLTSLLFFGSVLVHELAHALVALRNGVPVQQITLFIFGGAAYISEEPTKPGVEFRIAIAGPLASFALAGAFELLFLIDHAIPLLAAPSVWLARINLILALFNLIPGFPLDGGRMLRAAIWHWTGSFQRATLIASGIGQVVALGFSAWGIFTLLTGSIFNGLWLIFIGWFLQNAIAANYAQTSTRYLLHDVRVAQAMNTGFPRVTPLTSLQTLIDTQILTSGQRVFVVTNGDGIEGLLTINEIKDVPAAQRPLTTVGQIAVPLDRLEAVPPEMKLMDVLGRLGQAGVYIPVMEQGRLVGLLSREDVTRLLEVRAQLNVRMEPQL
ncbi:MAG: site-2 protease family protein [Anaerolineae bacterium]|nr:site-2 protease family protein [Anaerolineae bacterium]